MSGRPFVVRGRRVVTADALRPASIHISGEKITAIAGLDEIPPESPVLDAGDAVILPGVVDTHVHINEPGRTEWEGFYTATRAAAAGGVTTLVDMPLNSIPATTSVQAFEAKQAAARHQCWVDVGFWGGVVPGNDSEVSALSAAGVLGFKCFLVPSGVDEFAHVSEDHLARVMPELAALGAPLLVHAELPEPIALAFDEVGDAVRSRPFRYASYLAVRPKEAENAAIRLMIRLCRQSGARVHIVHLSSSQALADLRAARSDGLPITVETCPHYLLLSAEKIPDRATLFKCAPPIREETNQEELWQALDDGTIDMIGSDHSPSPPAMKCLDTGDFLKAWGGIASLQLGLPLMWTAARARSHTLMDLVKWMCERPAKLAGLGQKGLLAPGRDADLVIFDPDATFCVNPATLQMRHKHTPYAGQTLHGVVRHTLVRGQSVFLEGESTGTPIGRLMIPFPSE